MATEIKHKAQIELAKAAKRTKFEEDSFRERVRREKLEKRVNEQLRKLQTICETLDTKCVRSLILKFVDYLSYIINKIIFLLITGN
jgi:hypothetical protein